MDECLNFYILREDLMEHRIAAVIVNWNKKDQVLRLLNQLEQNYKSSFDTFVVDNASTDGSAEAIMKERPDVFLIVNKENLGGTGGFNSGIRHVVAQKKYHYIWLLDNDAEIDQKTLPNLVAVMESLPDVGIAGSRIVDIDNKKITVETGGCFRWDMMGVFALNRNTYMLKSNIIECDYVAICSALVRVSTLESVGFMDERLFLFWDDMDWGLTFKKHGYRVVSIPGSIAYHGSFTERERGDITNYYYGIRNPLLVYTKHASFLLRAVIFYHSLRYFGRSVYFMKMTDQRHKALLINQALNDYLNGRWGKVGQISQSFTDSNHNRCKEKSTSFQTILVSVLGTSQNEAQKMITTLQRSFPDSRITLLVSDDRCAYFNDFTVIQMNMKKTNDLLYLGSLFTRILLKRYDAIALSTAAPFAYASRYYLKFNNENEYYSTHHSGAFPIMKLFFSVLQGELFALIKLPGIMLSSYKYKKTIKSGVGEF